MSFDRAFDLFQRVCDLSEEERSRILDEECADDDGLREEVESLLEHDTEDDSVFDESMLAEVPHPPEEIGGYRILDVLGSGGMGVVYRAEQDSPRRIVALKVLRPGLASPELLRRFEYETQVLGRLDHPGVAKIFAAGTADTGLGAQPFFAMELVEGPTITEWAEHDDRSTGDRLEAFVSICEAVEHAHRKGVIHRDLKPSNILVRPDGQPVVLDFGIARAADTEAERTTMTRTGNIVGTLAYMSPEQAAGDPDDLDTRTDVYSLGMIFYRILTGCMPYDVGDRSLEAALRTIRDETPALMGRLETTLRGDLETIAARALEKDKGRRYQSAAELSADVKRHLEDEPITARPPSALYQIGKFARRNRVLVTSTLLILVLTLISLVVISYLFLGERDAREEAQVERDQAKDARKLAQDERDRATAARREAQDERDRARAAEQEAERRRREAERQRRIAEEINRFLNELLINANPNQNPEGTRVTVVEVLDWAERRLEGRFDDEPEIESELRLTLGIAYRGLGQLQKGRQQLDLALELNEDLDEEDPVRVAICTGHLGVLQLLSGRTAAALELLRDALGMLEDELGGDDPRVATAHLDLAQGLRTAGRYDDALKSARTALDLLSDRPGQAHHRANAHGTLADLARELSDFTAAELHLRQQIELLDELGGGDDAPRTAALGALGALLWQRTEFDEAVTIFERVVEGTRRIYGDSHFRLAQVLNNLAVAYRATGDHEAAQARLSEALPIALEHLGDDHGFVGTLKNNLARVMEHRGELARAETLYREALAIQIAAVGADHPVVATYHSNIGSTIAKAGRNDEALSAFGRALEILRAHFGNEHIRVANTLYDRAAARLEKDTDGARRDFIEAERIYRLVLEDASRDLNLGACLEQLGFLDVRQKNWKDAARRLEEAHTMFLGLWGAEEPRTRAVTEALASAYDELGRPEDAARVRSVVQ